MVKDQYDIAISVANPDLATAQELARRLEARGLRTYLYEESPETTLGSDLRNKLHAVYSQVPIILVLLSSEYRTTYTQIELQAALGGVASSEGVIPVLLDSTPIAAELAGRTYYTLERGSDGLVNAVLLKLRRRPFRPVVMGTAAIVSSLVGALAVVWILGFGDMSRFPDWLLIGLTVLPAIWAFVFRLGPWVLTAMRARRLPSQILLQSPLQAKLDSAGIYTGWLFATALPLAVAGAVVVSQDISNQLRARHALARDIRATYSDFYSAATTVTTLAARASTLIRLEDQPAAATLAIEYDSSRRKLDEMVERMTAQMTGAVYLQGSDATQGLTDCLQLLQRTADRYMGHQIQRLAATPSEALAPHLELERRVSVSETLSSYNMLFSESLLACDSRLTDLMSSIKAENDRFARTWHSVIG